MVISHSYVSLPEGILFVVSLRHQPFILRKELNGTHT